MVSFNYFTLLLDILRLVLPYHSLDTGVNYFILVTIHLRLDTLAFNFLRGSISAIEPAEIQLFPTPFNLFFGKVARAVSRIVFYLSPKVRLDFFINTL